MEPQKPTKLDETTPQHFHTTPTSCAILPTMHTTKLSTSYSICIEWTRYSALLTPQSYTHKRWPISAMFSSNKISQHNLDSNIPHRPSIAQALHSFCMQSRQTICHVQYSNYNAAIHNITHSPCNQNALHTHHYPLHYNNKNESYLCKRWQNGTRCRDGVKVLWCRSI